MMFLGPSGEANCGIHCALFTLSFPEFCGLRIVASQSYAFRCINDLQFPSPLHIGEAWRGCTWGS